MPSRTAQNRTTSPLALTPEEDAASKVAQGQLSASLMGGSRKRKAADVDSGPIAMTVGLHFYSHATLFDARNTFRSPFSYIHDSDLLVIGRGSEPAADTATNGKPTSAIDVGQYEKFKAMGDTDHAMFQSLKSVRSKTAVASRPPKILKT
ncbi:hypothetical protein B0H14DRAFT_3125715 [Mycena olivaceomarginata]|nr:hypothetical protein B0H14DRAFT_3125715 [Mycena olivaceomarginata]